MSIGVLTSWASFDPNVGMFGAGECVEIGVVQSVCGCVFQAYAATSSPTCTVASNSLTQLRRDLMHSTSSVYAIN